jgi:hypothetical protein
VAHILSLDSARTDATFVRLKNDSHAVNSLARERQRECWKLEVRRCTDKGGFDPISDVLPFGGLCCGESDAVPHVIKYAEFYSGSHVAVIRVYDEADNVIATHEHVGSSHAYPRRWWN